MSKILAFDVYGTLVDTAGIATQLARHVGDQAPAFAELWRSKQLEYSFRRGLMRNYCTFAVCTRQALDYCCEALRQPLADVVKQDLMAAYANLPPFAEVTEALARFKASEHRLYAFSNGAEMDVRQLLKASGLAGYFQDVVSVDPVHSFKPDPAVYAHFLRSADAQATQTWMISSNPFDVLGARSAGLCAAWIRRRPQPFDPWDLSPSLEVPNLGALADHFCH